MTTLQYLIVLIVLIITPGLVILGISYLPKNLRQKFQEKPNKATFFIIGIISIILLFLSLYQSY